MKRGSDRREFESDSVFCIDPRFIRGPAFSHLNQHVFHHAGRFDAGQTRVEPLVLHRELVVVDAEQVQRGRVQVVAIGGRDDRLGTEFVGLPVRRPSADPAPAIQAVNAPGL